LSLENISSVKSAFFINKSKGMHKSHIDFKFFVQQKHASFYESTCSFDQRHEKQNHKKNSQSWNFEEKGYKAKDSFLKPFDNQWAHNV
jgi:hypothetical protein